MKHPPNCRWLTAEQGSTVKLSFPSGEFAVTVHTDAEMDAIEDGAIVRVSNPPEHEEDNADAPAHAD
jgi:hypothetical protein